MEKACAIKDVREHDQGRGCQAARPAAAPDEQHCLSPNYNSIECQRQAEHNPRSREATHEKRDDAEDRCERQIKAKQRGNKIQR